MKPGDAFSVVLVSDSCAIHGVDTNELIMSLMHCIMRRQHVMRLTLVRVLASWSTGVKYQRAVVRAQLKARACQVARMS